jgi:hypothetical protein
MREEEGCGGMNYVFKLAYQAIHRREEKVPKTVLAVEAVEDLGRTSASRRSIAPACVPFPAYSCHVPAYPSHVPASHRHAGAEPHAIPPARL